jgi:hypothetical protein
MSISGFLRTVRGVLADRRGVTALAFAGSSMGVFGAVALATEAGVWYSARRGLSNAADIAAISAASTLPRQGAAAARTAAFDMARRNGFADGGANSVLVNIPPSSGAFAGNPAAVEVVVRQQQRTGVAGMLIESAPNVRGRSVATLVDNRDVCILALTGKLSLWGSANVDAPNCVLGSNRTVGIGVAFGNNVSVEGWGVSAVTACDGCDGGNVRLVEPAQERQLPIVNPFAHLDSKALPRFNGSTCLDPGSNPTNLQPYELNGRRAYCKDITLNAGTTLTLVPGTYYLSNASLQMSGGSTITCPTCTGGQGVTIVLTGDANKVGDIDIRGGATMVGLNAPAEPEDPDFRGVLFYRDVIANTGGGTAVKINGGADMGIAGGLYFPTSTVEFSGGESAAGCIVLVAGTIDMKGNAAASVTTCANTATAVPKTRIAAVVE